MIKVYFDGCCEPNPGGKIGYGFLVLENEEFIYESSQKYISAFPCETTNNVAEYCGIMAALKFLIFHSFQQKEIYIFGDSKLVIMQMQELWQIKSGKYKVFAERALELTKEFTHIHFEWIPHGRNTYADTLSRRAIYG